MGNPIIQPQLHAHECGYYEIIIPFGPPVGELPADLKQATHELPYELIELLHTWVPQVMFAKEVLARRSCACATSPSASALH